MAPADPQLDLSDPAALDAVLDVLAPAGDYARGVLDLLRLLNLTAGPGDRPEAADEVAAMLLASLRAHLADGLPVGIDWGDLDGGGLRGVDVLRAIEEARVRAVDDPTPGRVVRVVQSVIKARRGGEDLYLMQYDRHAGRYQPIGGKQDPDDASPEAALRREVYEELELPAVPDAGSLPLASLGEPWRTQTLSATYGILTGYEMHFFAAERVGFEIATDTETRWLTRAEIAALTAADGRAITPIYQQGLGGLEPLDALPPVMALD